MNLKLHIISECLAKKNVQAGVLYVYKWETMQPQKPFSMFMRRVAK